MPAWLAGFLQFLAFEALLFAGSLIMVPPPRALVIMSGAAAFYLLALYFNKPSVAEGLLGERTPNDIEFVRKPLAAVASGLAVLAFLIALGQPLEILFWRTGTFGEPPFNRWFRPAEYDDNHMMIEFSVLTTPVEQFDVRVDFNEGDDWREVRAILAPPCSIGPPEPSICPGYARGTGRNTDAPHKWRLEALRGAITTDCSLYVIYPKSFGSSVEKKTRACSFRSASDPPGLFGDCLTMARERFIERRLWGLDHLLTTKCLALNP